MSRIFSWLLNTVYLMLLLVSAPLILYAVVRKGKYREGYAQKLLGRVPQRSGCACCVWMHAVSVGEVNLLATMIGRLRRLHPEWDIVVSTTTKTGYHLARKKYDLPVFYCPLDFSWAVRRAMRRIRPTILVLAELELWPNLIREAKRHGAKVAIVNGRLSEKSFRGYRRIRRLIDSLLGQIDVIATQDQATADRFLALGAPKDAVHVTGSLKYEGAEMNRRNRRTDHLRQLARIRGDDIVFLAGSTQDPEEQIVLYIYRRLAAQQPQLRLILVPRHPERFDEVARLLSSSGLAWQRRSELAGPVVDTVDGDAPAVRPVLLVDSVGELGAWWGTAHIAFVGGSFGSRGGQNMIEPAAYGAAVSFGPNTWNFRDIVAALLAADAAAVVRSPEDLAHFAQRCLDDRAYASQLGENARALIASQQGATKRTMQLLAAVLDGESGARAKCLGAA